MNERRPVGGIWLFSTAITATLALSAALLYSADFRVNNAVRIHEQFDAASGAAASTQAKLEDLDDFRLRRDSTALVPAVQGPEPSRSMRQEFLASTELRSYAIRARDRPADGGAFYAIRAMAECRLQPSLPTELQDASPNAISHRRAQFNAANAERRTMRCAAFSTEELSDHATSQIQASGVRAGDPLLLLMDAWIDAVDSDDSPALRRLWRAVIDTGEPLLLEWVVEAGAGLFEPDSRLARDSAAADFVDYQLVWSAVKCELGAGCLEPRGPPDAICEHLLRCARERWGSGVSPAMPSTLIEAALAEVTAMAHRLRRREALGFFARSNSIAACLRSPCASARAGTLSSVTYR